MRTGSANLYLYLTGADLCRDLKMTPSAVSIHLSKSRRKRTECAMLQRCFLII
ncbi:MAG: ArsR family transcriptional regulator [Ruminococcaceae bacterium]|nr:ArsR family transcriptional regulator [Oscillospiraceae bacterium]